MEDPTTRSILTISTPNNLRYPELLFCKSGFHLARLHKTICVTCVEILRYINFTTNIFWGMLTLGAFFFFEVIKSELFKKKTRLYNFPSYVTLVVSNKEILRQRKRKR